MENININIIPHCILGKLFSLKKINMFVLPNSYFLGKVYFNNWTQIISQKLINIKKGIKII